MCAKWIAMLIAVAPCVQASRVKPVPSGSLVDVQSGVELEDWERAICFKMIDGKTLTEIGPQKVKGEDKGGINAEACRKAVDAEVAYRETVPKVSQNYEARYNQWTRETEKVKLQVLEPLPSHNIRDAVQPCEDEVESVCQESLCPILNMAKAARDKADGKVKEDKETKEDKEEKSKKMKAECEKTCKNSLSQMWKTGSVNCTKDETFQDCQDRLYENLEKEGREKGMEAILREHTLKCMCVAWRTKETRDICYSGGKGIPKGSKWCEFWDTPSWVKVLKDIPAINDKETNQLMPSLFESALPLAECSEIPGPNGDKATAEMAATLCEQNAAPHTARIAMGTMVGLLWLQASM